MCCKKLGPTQEFPLFCQITSKSTSPKQLHVAQGPTIFKISSLLAFWIVNLGRKGSHFCATYPTVVPGGASISNCKKK